MKIFVKLVEKINYLFGFVSGCCIVVGASLIITEIIFRCFSKSILISDEFTGYLMAVSSMMGLGYVEMTGGHIRMDLMDFLLSKYPKVIYRMKIISYFVVIIFAFYLTYVSFRLFSQSLANKTHSMQGSGILLAIPQIFMPVGAFGLLVQYFCNLYKLCANPNMERLDD
jgi:TRAP-type C4-dicarboxylate transport system permease small subunit